MYTNRDYFINVWLRVHILRIDIDALTCFFFLLSMYTAFFVFFFTLMAYGKNLLLVEP